MLKRFRKKARDGTGERVPVTAPSDDRHPVVDRLITTKDRMKGGSEKRFPVSFAHRTAQIALDMSLHDDGKTAIKWNKVSSAFVPTVRRIQGSWNEVHRGDSPRDQALYRLRYWAEPNNHTGSINGSALAAQIDTLSYLYAAVSVVPDGLNGLILDLLDDIE